MRRTILLLSVFALTLASCDGGTEEAKPSGSATPGASASVSTAAGSPTASPTPEVLADYDVTPYELPPLGELKGMYDYDPSEPLGYVEVGRHRERGATALDIEYKSSGCTVPAMLVVPDGQGPFPVVLYAHGYGMTRTYFLDDALALAREGYAGLLIQYPHDRKPFVQFFSWRGPSDIKGFEQYVIDLRRGLDLLQTLPEIDATRIGFVGHSIGGWVGAILSGVDDRIDAYVLTSVGSYGSAQPDRSLFAAPLPVDGALTRYQDAIAVVYPVDYVGHNRGAAFLFQASKADEIVSLGNIRALFEAAPEPRTLRWYAGPGRSLYAYEHHHLGCEQKYWGWAATMKYYQGCPANLPAFEFHRAWLEENV
jgi:dienelactone hydrolase